MSRILRPSILAVLTLLAASIPSAADTFDITTTNDVGDEIRWQIDNCTGYLNEGGHTYIDNWSMGYDIPSYVHTYSVYKEPDKSRYSMVATAYPGGGDAGGGYYTTNYLKVYAYEDWDNYEVGWSIKWMPPGGYPRVRASGEFIRGPDIFKILFDGHGPTGRITHRFYVMVSVFNMESPEAYNYWGFGGGGGGFGGGGGGGGWPPWPGDDGDPPDPDSPDWEGGTGGSPGLGPGFCSINGLPVWHVNPANRNLLVRDMDFSYRSLGPDIEIERTYNAFLIPGAPSIGMFGRQWRLEYEWSFGSSGVIVGGEDDDLSTVVPPEVYFIDGEGIRYDFQSQGATSGERPYTLTSPEGERMSLTLNAAGDQWVMHDNDEYLTYRFGAYTANWAPYLARLESIADSSGNTVAIEYYEDEYPHAHEFFRISRITDAVGRVTSFTLTNASGFPLCSRMTTPDGRSVSYEYDDDSNLVRVVDMLGTEINHTYSTSINHSPMTQIQVGSKIETFNYDPPGDGSPEISSVVDAEGRSITHFSDGNGTTSVMGASGDITTYTSNSNGQITSVMNSQGQVCSADFANGQLTGIARAGGGNTTRIYDAAGNLTQIVDPTGAATQLNYDSDGRLVSRIDPVGAQWTYVRDASERISQMGLPSGLSISYTRNAQGQVTGKTILGSPTLKGIRAVPDRTASYEYDAWGNIAAAVSPAGARTTFEYDAKGLHCTAVVDPVGRRTEFEYDANDRLVKTTRPDGKTRSYSYLPCSWVATTNASSKTLSVTRDKTFRILSLTNGAGDTTTYDYDADGRRVSRTDPEGNTFFYVYDAMGRYLGTTSTLGRRLDQQYDSDWNVAGVTDGRGNTTRYRYDAAGRRIAVGDPLGSSVTLTRDPAGRITQITNARDQAITFAYDVSGRLVRRSYDGAVAAELTYDVAGRLVEMRDPRGITGFAYNADDVLTGISYYDGMAISIAPDGVGRAESLAYPGGLNVSYTYDVLGRTTAVSWSGASVSFTYTDTGEIATVTRGNGTSTAYTYDDARRVASVTHNDGSSDFAAVAVTRDDAGRIVSLDESLPAVPVLSDQASSATYDAANQISDMAAAAYTYDADGNLVASGLGAWTAAYNAVNRPTQVVRNGLTATYDYDALGYRTRVTIGESQVRDYHLSHVGTILFETDAWGALRACFIYASGRPVAMWTPSGGTFYYHYDQNLHTIALTDASGDVVAAYRYTPYGLIAGQSGSVDNPFTWCGGMGVVGDGGGLYWMTHRLYDAASGRFLSRDPIGQRGGVNLYAYAGGDPANRADPSGLYGGYGTLSLSCEPMTEEDYQRQQKIDHGIQLTLEVGWNWVPGSGIVDAVYHTYEGKYGTALWDLAKFGMGPVGSTIGSAERLAQELPESSPEEIEARMADWKDTQDRLSGKIVDPGDFPDQPGAGEEYGGEPVMVEGPPE